MQSPIKNSSLAKKLSGYKPSPAAIKLIKSTRILFLVGPTGAGKDALKDELLSTGNYHHIVSHTTREPRINHGILEEDGRDYHFISKAEAERMVDNKAFIEAKIYSGNLYGTSVAEIKLAHDQNLIAMTDIEVQGVAEYKELDPNVMAVFLLPPDFKTWQQRLTRRYGDVVDEVDHQMRLETALVELDELINTDYYVPVINDDLNQTFAAVHKIVASKNHTSADAPRARAVAQQLDIDIRDYLQTLK
ncbi:MAG TPA: hypothetical protein VFN51_02565 [Candidatus Saccharimonadales bacterium]|nr:hypothetical protein [Candidatus Saccharimonadales bacterium]